MVEFIVESALLYAIVGMVFAIPFAWRGVGSVDAVALHATLGFRVLAVPGAALLWPLLAIRWWRAATAGSGGDGAGTEVPGDRTDLWSAPCERLRRRALAIWCVLLPVLAAVMVIALLARDPAAPAAPDAARLPASNPSGAGR